MRTEKINPLTFKYLLFFGLSIFVYGQSHASLPKPPSTRIKVLLENGSQTTVISQKKNAVVCDTEVMSGYPMIKGAPDEIWPKLKAEKGFTPKSLDCRKKAFIEKRTQAKTKYYQGCVDKNLKLSSWLDEVSRRCGR